MDKNAYREHFDKNVVFSSDFIKKTTVIIENAADKQSNIPADIIDFSSVKKPNRYTRMRNFAVSAAAVLLICVTAVSLLKINNPPSADVPSADSGSSALSAVLSQDSNLTTHTSSQHESNDSNVGSSSQSGTSTQATIASQSNSTSTATSASQSKPSSSATNTHSSQAPASSSHSSHSVASQFVPPISSVTSSQCDSSPSYNSYTSSSSSSSFTSLESIDKVDFIYTVNQDGSVITSISSGYTPHSATLTTNSTGEAFVDKNGTVVLKKGQKIVYTITLNYSKSLFAAIDSSFLYNSSFDLATNSSDMYLMSFKGLGISGPVNGSYAEGNGNIAVVMNTSNKGTISWNAADKDGISFAGGKELMSVTLIANKDTTCSVEDLTSLNSFVYRELFDTEYQNIDFAGMYGKITVSFE